MTRKNKSETESREKNNTPILEEENNQRKDNAKIIMICGNGRGIGKTTLSNNLKINFESNGKKAMILSFADMPRKITAKILLFLQQQMNGEIPKKDEEKEKVLRELLKNEKEKKPFEELNLTYRNFLISIAEGVRFSLDENLWTVLLLEQALGISESYHYIIIDDHRKEYEYKTLKENYPGKIIRIFLNGKEEKTGTSYYFEGEIKKEDCDLILNNTDILFDFL